MRSIDEQYGNVMANGTVTGMVGMVARHEVHLAISDVAILGTVLSCTVVSCSVFIFNINGNN